MTTDVDIPVRAKNTAEEEPTGAGRSNGSAPSPSSTARWSR